MICRILTVCIASMFLTSCFLSPGKFASQVTIKSSGEFAFTYKGEIWVLGLSGLSDIGRQASEADFEPTCYDEDSGELRDCSEQEAAEQLDAEKTENKRIAESFKALLGGLDPNDPQAVAKFIEQIKRQKGWNNVVHKGDGVFDVDFAITGPLSHNFQFPVIDRVTNVTPFVSIIIRKDNKVRIVGSGFAQDENSLGFPALGALAGAGDSNTPSDIPKSVTPDGRFTVRTDGAILTNNTEEGANIADNGDKILEWSIDAITKNAPEALIGLGSQ